MSERLNLEPDEPIPDFLVQRLDRAVEIAVTSVMMGIADGATDAETFTELARFVNTKKHRSVSNVCAWLLFKEAKRQMTAPNTPEGIENA